MYSSNCSAPKVGFSATGIASPAFVRRLRSAISLTAGWSASGMPKSMPMTRMGTKIRDEVKLSYPHQRVERRRAKLTDLGLQRSDAPRREHAREQGAMYIVHRRILEDQSAWRKIDVRLDQLENASLSRDEAFGIHEAALTVGIAAHCIEV